MTLDKYYIFYTTSGGGHGEPSKEQKVKGVSAEKVGSLIRLLRIDHCDIHAVVYGVRMDKWEGEKI